MPTDGLVSPACTSALTSDDTDVEALRAQVIKWQKQVPKIASALRERTEELHALRDQLRQGRSSADSGADARLHDRNQHKQHWRTQRELLVAEHNQQLERAGRYVESLKVRNANLAETTEFANRQIESLSKEVSRLEDAQTELKTRLREAEERSAQAMLTAEQQQRQLIDMLGAKDQTIAELQQAQQQEQHHQHAQRSADTLKQYAKDLEDRLESYKSLMSDLENELSDIQGLRNSESRKFDQQLRDADGLLIEAQKQLAAEREARVIQQHAVCTLEEQVYLLKHEVDTMRECQADDAPRTHRESGHCAVAHGAAETEPV